MAKEKNLKWKGNMHRKGDEILDKAVREGLTEKMTFDQRCEGY